MPADDLRPARGVLLVARPHLLDPNFQHTVVLLCDHDDAEGTLGFVLNRPSENSLAEVLQGDHEFRGRRDPVYLGGPVGLDQLAILHREPGLPGAVEVLPGVFAGGDAALLGERVREKGTPPSEIRFLVGYSGWGKRQLASEMDEETWVLCPARPEWVFDPEPETLWRRVLRSMGGPYAVLANTPADPELN
jgi:putative transcriptional regulator